ncbi:MAG: hypothetical protein FD153_1243 [Rhodospirillaceae bacterium]|nr:MAG: hypothetical protein FD153_1243 [Rhodospirillaceae bacterium]
MDGAYGLCLEENADTLVRNDRHDGRGNGVDNSLTGPRSYGLKTTNNIVVEEGLPLVFPSLDQGLLMLVVYDQPDHALPDTGTRSDHTTAVAMPGDSKKHADLLPGPVDRLPRLFRTGTRQVDHAMNGKLGRVEIGQTKMFSVGLLPL